MTEATKMWAVYSNTGALSTSLWQSEGGATRYVEGLNLAGGYKQYEVKPVWVVPEELVQGMFGVFGPGGHIHEATTEEHAAQAATTFIDIDDEDDRYETEVKHALIFQNPEAS